MTLEEAQAAVGQPVIYTQLYGAHEYGKITEVRRDLVMVLYLGDREAKATHPGDLELLP